MFTFTPVYRLAINGGPRMDVEISQGAFHPITDPPNLSWQPGPLFKWNEDSANWPAMVAQGLIPKKEMNANNE